MRETQTKSDSLQQNNQTKTISDFVRRTDALADRTGLNLSELPEKLGFSKPMLFAYRSGKNRITPKVWLKLERAERDAGGADPGAGGNIPFVESKGEVKEADWRSSNNFESVVREDETPYRVTPAVEEPELLPPAGIEAMLERIAKALERLIEIEELRTPKP